MGGCKDTKEREDEASYSRPTRLGEKGGDLDFPAEGSHFRRRFGREWTKLTVNITTGG